MSSPPAMPIPFSSTATYQFSNGHIACTAFAITDEADCKLWIEGDVAKRVYDQPMKLDFLDTINAIKSEGFNTTLLETYIQEAPPLATDGDVGEGIADLFLMERFGVHLPTNRRRDLRTPKGSHPGADIAGYAPDGVGGADFVFGEVKASGQKIAPPSVMTHTDSGMPAQLLRLALDSAIQRQLLFYLQARAKGAPAKALHISALKAFAAGKFKLIGVLVRTTSPSQLDVSGPALKLQATIPASQPCSLYVLHTGLSTDDWLVHCQPT
jgi:hypothetical protein